MHAHECTEMCVRVEARAELDVQCLFSKNWSFTELEACCFPKAGVTAVFDFYTLGI